MEETEKTIETYAMRKWKQKGVLARIVDVGAFVFMGIFRMLFAVRATTMIQVNDASARARKAKKRLSTRQRGGLIEQKDIELVIRHSNELPVFGVLDNKQLRHTWSRVRPHRPKEVIYSYTNDMIPLRLQRERETFRVRKRVSK
eukprot:gene6314-4544_t